MAARLDGDGGFGDRQQARWARIARADGRVAVLVALATALTSGALYSRPVPGAAPPWGPLAFVAPAVGALFFLALMAMFAETRRHGQVRALLILGSAVLTVAGALFWGRPGALAVVVVSYWAPALFALVAALMLREARRVGRPRAAARPDTPRVPGRFGGADSVWEEGSASSGPRR